CEHLRQHSPEKHALLNRLLAEEFTRRVVIVHTHRADRDLRSLVDRRYIILAIHHGLESLTIALEQLLSEHGRVRCRWVIPRRTRLTTYHWIYRWLYIEQLNAGTHALSQQYGAERLKRALLEKFLAVVPDPTRLFDGNISRGRNDLRRYEVTTEILQSLVYTAVRTCDAQSADTSLRTLEELQSKVRAAVE